MKDKKIQQIKNLQKEETANKKVVAMLKNSPQNLELYVLWVVWHRETQTLEDVIEGLQERGYNRGEGSIENYARGLLLLPPCDGE